MGDCLTSPSSTPALPSKENPAEERTRHNILPTSVANSAASQLSAPNVIVHPPPKQEGRPREPSVDRRECSQRASLSVACENRESKQAEFGLTDSYVVRELEKGRRSSGMPVQINPTVSYLVDGGRGVADNDITLSLVNGEVIVGRNSQPSRHAQESVVFGMIRTESVEEPYVRPSVEQSAVVVNTKSPTQQEPSFPRPNIEQSAVVVGTRPVRP